MASNIHPSDLGPDPPHDSHYSPNHLSHSFRHQRNLSNASQASSLSLLQDTGYPSAIPNALIASPASSFADAPSPTKDQSYVDEPLPMEGNFASLDLTSTSATSLASLNPAAQPQRYDTLTWAKAHAFPEPCQDTMLATGGLHPKSSISSITALIDSHSQLHSPFEIDHQSLGSAAPPSPAFSAPTDYLSPRTQAGSPFIHSTTPSPPALPAFGEQQQQIPTIDVTNPGLSGSSFLRLDMNHPAMSNSPSISLTAATPLTARPGQAGEFQKVLEQIVKAQSSESPASHTLVPPSVEQHNTSYQCESSYQNLNVDQQSSYQVETNNYQNVEHQASYQPESNFQGVVEQPSGYQNIDHQQSTYPSPTQLEQPSNVYPPYNTLLFDRACDFLSTLSVQSTSSTFLNPRPVRSRQRSKSESIAKQTSTSSTLPTFVLPPNNVAPGPESAPSIWPSSFFPDLSLPFSPTYGIESSSPSSPRPCNEHVEARRSIGGPGYDTSFLSASPGPYRRSHSVSHNGIGGHRRGGSETQLDFLSYTTHIPNESNNNNSVGGSGSRERSYSQSSHSEVSVSLSRTTAATKAAAAKRRKEGSQARYVCEMCGETFTRRYNLRGHQRAHKGEKPFACGFPGCTSSFARAHDQKRHYKLHLGVKDYNCKACGKAFIRLDALQRHHKSDAGQACFFQLSTSENNHHLHLHQLHPNPHHHHDHQNNLDQDWSASSGGQNLEQQ